MIAVLSDTHMPKGTRRLPERCVELVQAADSVIHAGDFCTGAVLSEIEALNPRVDAVFGNVDVGALRARLPETVTVGLGERRIAVLHDAGPANGRLSRLRRRFADADAVIFGHSHLPLHETDGDGFQIFNPGSPTERRRSPRHSLGLLSLEGGRLVFEHVWL